MTHAAILYTHDGSHTTTLPGVVQEGAPEASVTEIALPHHGLQRRVEDRTHGLSTWDLVEAVRSGRPLAYVTNTHASKPRFLRGFTTLASDSSTSLPGAGTEGEEEFTLAYDTAQNDLSAALDAAETERFDPGEDTEFEQRIRRLLLDYRRVAVALLDSEFDSIARSNRTAAVVMLGLLGEDRDSATHELRLALIGRALSSPMASLRDAAALAAYRLRDKRSLHLLEVTRGREHNIQLQRNLDQLIARLHQHR